MMNQKKMTTKNQKIKINFPQLYPAQQKVIKACLNKSDKYIVLNGSRQVGKTFILAITSVYWALQNKNQNLMVVSPTDSMVRKVYKDVINLLNNAISHIVKSKKTQAGDSQITFINGSTILFRSAASEDSLRGYSLTHLLLDEAAFVKEETWNTILAPTLTVRGKKVLFCSTPKGQNFFQKLYYKGLSNEDGYKSFQINWRDNPFADTEFIKGQKENLPDEIYNQEYEGKFIDSASVFKHVKELSILAKRNPPAECVIGIDIAFKRDYTVAVCYDINGNMLDYIRYNNIETQESVELLYQFIQKWKPMKTIFE